MDRDAEYYLDGGAMIDFRTEGTHKILLRLCGYPETSEGITRNQLRAKVDKVQNALGGRSLRRLPDCRVI